MTDFSHQSAAVTLLRCMWCSTASECYVCDVCVMQHECSHFHTEPDTSRRVTTGPTGPTGHDGPDGSRRVSDGSADGSADGSRRVRRARRITQQITMINHYVHSATMCTLVRPSFEVSTLAHIKVGIPLTLTPHRIALTLTPHHVLFLRRRATCRWNSTSESYLGLDW